MACVCVFVCFYLHINFHARINVYVFNPFVIYVCSCFKRLSGNRGNFHGNILNRFTVGKRYFIRTFLLCVHHNCVFILICVHVEALIVAQSNSCILICMRQHFIVNCKNHRTKFRFFIVHGNIKEDFRTHFYRKFRAVFYLFFICSIRQIEFRYEHFFRRIRVTIIFFDNGILRNRNFIRTACLCSFGESINRCRLFRKFVCFSTLYDNLRFRRKISIFFGINRSLFNVIIFRQGKFHANLPSITVPICIYKRKRSYAVFHAFAITAVIDNVLNVRDQFLVFCKFRVFKVFLIGSIVFACFFVECFYKRIHTVNNAEITPNVRKVKAVAVHHIFARFFRGKFAVFNCENVSVFIKGIIAFFLAVIALHAYVRIIFKEFVICVIFGRIITVICHFYSTVRNCFLLRVCNFKRFCYRSNGQNGNRCAAIYALANIVFFVRHFFRLYVVTASSCVIVTVFTCSPFCRIGVFVAAGIAAIITLAVVIRINVCNHLRIQPFAITGECFPVPSHVTGPFRRIGMFAIVALAAARSQSTESNYHRQC